MPIRPPPKYLVIINICLNTFLICRAAPCALSPQSPQQPREFAEGFHRSHHAGFWNPHASFPLIHTGHACRFTALRTQRAFPLPWLCPAAPLPRRKPPSLFSQGAPCSSQCGSHLLRRRLGISQISTFKVREAAVTARCKALIKVSSV